MSYLSELFPFFEIELGALVLLQSRELINETIYDDISQTVLDNI